jgi:hypothetical protein
VVFAAVLQDEVAAFTVTKDWMDRVVKVFDPFDMHGCKKTERTQASLDLVQERATKFGNVCRARLQQHLLSRGYVSKSGHWVYKWARRNATLVGAILDTMGMLRDDLDVTSSSVCLLQSLFRGQAFVMAEANAGSTMEGSYIFVNSQDASFVRTGKAVKTTIGERCQVHAKASKKGSSKFYLSFPDKDVEHKASQRRGHFQDLQVFCGLCFSRTKDDSYKMLYKTSGDGGIFLWDMEVLDPLEKSKFNTCIKEKQLHMVGYLCELFLELALCPENNVSESPGFEAVIGIG